MNMGLTYKVAALKASPIFFDLEASLAKALTLIREAASNGAKLIVFPELFLPGYPFYIWLFPYGQTVQYIEKYYQNSPYSPSTAKSAPGHGLGEDFRVKASSTLESIAKELDVSICMGVSEREHGSLYMAQWLIGPQGFIASRRKLKPTLTERLVFGEGSGSDVKVFQTPLGRLGALNCWEHVQPLIKHAMASQFEEIHCASWPHFSPHLPHNSLSAEANYSANMMYAIEVGCFNIVSTAPLSQQNQDVIVNGHDNLREFMPIGGGICQIFDPEGRPLVDRPAHDKEVIVYADIDLGKCLLAKAAMDIVGHYSRKDVFQLTHVGLGNILKSDEITDSEDGVVV